MAAVASPIRAEVSIIVIIFLIRMKAGFGAISGGLADSCTV